MKTRQTTYLDPTDETVGAFLARHAGGEVVMLNLLRFREIADYSQHPELAPPSQVSGREAYERYIRHTLPFLRKSGGDLTYVGTGGSYLVGPSGAGWDMAMLVRQESIESFLAFASDQEYLAGIGHRVAALTDSRILPLTDETDRWRSS